MTTNIHATFTDGESSVVAFSFTDRERIWLVLKAWAILNMRDVKEWKETTATADCFYEAEGERIGFYHRPGYDLLGDLLPVAAMKKSQGKPSAEN